MHDFLARIKAGETLILDGGMGSLLQQLGGSMKSSENNLLYPQVVEKAHRLYLEAGSDAIITNTFSLNGIYAAKQKLTPEETERSLRAAMEIALRAADGKHYLLADLGPSGEMLAPFGTGDKEEYYRAYRLQAEQMAEYAIDAFIIETVIDINEALIILQACQDTAPQIPVLLSLTFSSLKRGGCTLMGNTAADIAAKAEGNGAAAVGANCGDLTPEQYAQIVTSMHEACSLPLLLQPNAGKPKREGKQAVYPLSPAEFAQQMQSCYAPRARILGGCCRTTPEHIAALVQSLKS